MAIGNPGLVSFFLSFFLLSFFSPAVAAHLDVTIDWGGWEPSKKEEKKRNERERERDLNGDKKDRRGGAIEERTVRE